MKMFNLRVCFFLIVNLIVFSKCSIPTEILCANPTCTEPISMAKGSILYTSSSPDVLSFKPGQEIKITSKSKNKGEYWRAIIEKRIGYVPSDFIKEFKVFYSYNDLIPISVASISENVASGAKREPENNIINEKKSESLPSLPSSEPNIQNTVASTETNSLTPNFDSDKKKGGEAYEVVEGTTLYVGEANTITPSTVKINTQTAVPEEPPRATLPPEVINLNGDYKGQLLLSKKNLTVEVDEDEDEEDLDGNDDDDDDEDEEEEEEEENIELTSGPNYEEKVRENTKDSSTNLPVANQPESTNEIKVEETVAISSEPVFENVNTTDSETMIMAEDSVTNKINSQMNLNEYKAQEDSQTIQNSVNPDIMNSKIHNTVSDTVSNPESLNTGPYSQVASPEFTLGAPQAASNPNIFNAAQVQSDPKYLSESEISHFVPDNQNFQTVPNPDNPSTIPNSVSNQGVPPPNSKPSISNSIPNHQVPQSSYGSEIPNSFLNSEVESTLSPSPSNPGILSPDYKSKVPDTFTSSEVPEAVHASDERNTILSSESTQKIPNTQTLKTVANSEIPSLSDSPISDTKLNLKTPETVTQSMITSDEDYLKKFLSDENPTATYEEVTTPEPRLADPSTLSSNYINTDQGINSETALKSQNEKSKMDLTEMTPELLTEMTPELLTEMTNFYKKAPQEWMTERPDVPGEKEEESKGAGNSEALTPTPDSLEEIVAEESGLMRQITEMFSGWFESSNEEVIDGKDSDKMFVEPQKNDIRVDSQSEASTNKPEGICQSLDEDCGNYVAKEQHTFAWGSLFPLSIMNVDGIPGSSNIFLYLVVTAVTVLIFTLGHSFIENKGKTAPLIAKINKLEQELLITTKENVLLKDEIQNTKEKITLYENSANDKLVLSLQAELEESKKTRAELESSIEVLQQELDAATEAGLDLNKMLSEVLTQKGGSESLLASVENLQAQLNSQQQVIDEMTKKLGVKNEENDALQTALETANEKVENLEEQLTDIKHNLNMHLEEKEELTLGLNNEIAQLRTQICQMNLSKEKDKLKMKNKMKELENKCSETSTALSIKEEELKALKESIKHLKSKGNVNLETVFDVSRIKAELTNAEKEKQILKDALKKKEDGKKKLEEETKSLNLEVQKLKKSYEEAELKKDEAEKKLEVLSTYFKEKETQLQKELGLQEALWAQKKGDEKAVYDMIKSLQEEVDSYKSQNETLKQEILDQERGLKNQIAILEQKAHENWVAARQAERKLEESKQEMAQLRNRLTLIEKNATNIEAKTNHRSTEELNGEPTSPALHDTSSPLLFPPPLPLDPNSSSLLPPGFMPHPMFMPPPMGGFMPPPPFLPGDRRPPPLGRMSSPPLNNRFSPSSPADYPSFERMSSPPLSPPGRNFRSPNEAERELFRHRTPPFPPLHSRNWDDSNEMPGFIPISSQRDSIRDHKGSNVSSGHSSSDSLDKSSRHSGRV